MKYIIAKQEYDKEELVHINIWDEMGVADDETAFRIYIEGDIPEGTDQGKVIDDIEKLLKDNGHIMAGTKKQPPSDPPENEWDVGNYAVYVRYPHAVHAVSNGNYLYISPVDTEQCEDFLEDLVQKISTLKHNGKPLVVYSES